MAYEPTDLDITWAETMLRMIRDGGTFIFPSTMLMFRVDHTRQTLSLLLPPNDQSSDQTLARTCVVFGKLGYSVDVDPDLSRRILALADAVLGLPPTEGGGRSE